MGSFASRSVKTRSRTRALCSCRQSQSSTRCPRRSKWKLTRHVVRLVPSCCRRATVVWLVPSCCCAQSMRVAEVTMEMLKASNVLNGENKVQLVPRPSSQVTIGMPFPRMHMQRDNRMERRLPGSEPLPVWSFMCVLLTCRTLLDVCFLHRMSTSLHWPFWMFSRAPTVGLCPWSAADCLSTAPVVPTLASQESLTTKPLLRTIDTAIVRRVRSCIYTRRQSFTCLNTPPRQSSAIPVAWSLPRIALF